MSRTKTATIAALLSLTFAIPSADANLIGNQIAAADKPYDVAAGNGILAYGQPTATGGYGIALRPRGATAAALLQIAPLTSSPAIELVTNRLVPSGALVYPRCTTTTPTTCRLAIYLMASGVERIVPKTDGAQRGTMLDDGTFVWAGQRQDGGATLHTTFRGKMSRLRIPSRSTLDYRPTPPVQRTIPRSTMRISDLASHGSEISYILNYAPPGGFFESELWVQRVIPTVRPPRLVGRIGTGGAAPNIRSFVGLHLGPRSVTTYRQGLDIGNRVVRYQSTAFSRRERVAASLRQSFVEQVHAAAFDGDHAYAVVGPYQTDSCSRDREPDPASKVGDPLGSGCRLLDTGPLKLTPPKPRR